MRSETRRKIKGYLEGFIQDLIDQRISTDADPRKLRPIRTHSETGDIKPFHEALLPDGVLGTSEFERSFSTKLGTTFEECAKLIAEDYHRMAMRSYKIMGFLNSQAAQFIDKTLDEIKDNGMQLNYVELVEEIVELASYPSSHRKHKEQADLFIVNRAGVEVFIELKSPKPNKGQCLEATRRILNVYAMKYEQYPNVRSYFATAYNPWGVVKADYRHSLTKTYMDMEHQVLLGSEFWEMIGGYGSYDAVLDVFQEVGREKGADMLDQLALGY